MFELAALGPFLLFLVIDRLGDVLRLLEFAFKLAELILLFFVWRAVRVKVIR